MTGRSNPDAAVARAARVGAVVVRSIFRADIAVKTKLNKTDTVT